MNVWNYFREYLIFVLILAFFLTFCDTFGFQTFTLIVQMCQNLWDIMLTVLHLSSRRSKLLAITTCKCSDNKIALKVQLRQYLPPTPEIQKYLISLLSLPFWLVLDLKPSKCLSYFRWWLVRSEGLQTPHNHFSGEIGSTQYPGANQEQNADDTEVCTVYVDKRQHPW